MSNPTPGQETVMDSKATHTLATDDATASVRPADARYNRQKFTTEQLAEIREAEIEEATVKLLEQRKAQEEENQKALDDAGYVNPTVQPEESPVARAFDKVYGSRSGDSSSPDGGTPDGGTPDGGTPDGGTPDDLSDQSPADTASARTAKKSAPAKP